MNRRMHLGLWTVIGASMVASGCASMRASEAAATGAEVTVQVAAPLDVTRNRVLRAFTDQKLMVSSQQDQLIEAKLPRESGMLGSYELVARALLLTVDGGTRVTLYGEEFLDAGGGATNTHRVNPNSRGRAGRVWEQLNAIADSLRKP